MNKLTKEQVLLLHQELILEFGGSDGIRDEGLNDERTCEIYSFYRTENQIFFHRKERRCLPTSFVISLFLLSSVCILKLSNQLSLHL